MSETPENHTIRLLQDMRKEMQEMREDLTVRIDGITHNMTLMAGHYHNVEDRLSNLEAQAKS